MLYHWHYQINQCWLQSTQSQETSSDWLEINEERSSTDQEESQSSWTTWEDYHLWLTLRRFADRDADIQQTESLSASNEHDIEAQNISS